MSQCLIFIHRSVGRDLIHRGDLRPLLHDQNIVLDDYDNNTGVLTRSDGSLDPSPIVMPGNNTNPDNLDQYFAKWDMKLDPYNAIMVKSCYPNSRIKTDEQLEEIKSHYNNMFAVFAKHPNRQFLILTSPPLRPLFTNVGEARRAMALAGWLMATQKNNIHVFDFHAALSEISGNHAGMLKRSYRRLLPIDTHPNDAADKVIAPQIADFIIKALKS